MDLLQRLSENAQAIGRAGHWAAARARAEGRAFYYIDDNVGPGIVEELPNGARSRIVKDGDGYLTIPIVG